MVLWETICTVALIVVATAIPSVALSPDQVAVGHFQCYGSPEQGCNGTVIPGVTDARECCLGDGYWFQPALSDECVQCFVCERGGLDLYFVLDSSETIESANFRQMLQFVEGTVAAFTIGLNATRVGVIRFATSAQIIFPLDMHTSLSDLTAAIQSISYTRGGTDTAEALNLLVNQGFIQANGARPVGEGIPRVAVIVTDGTSNDRAATRQAAQRVCQNGIISFAIGIGSRVDTHELNSIACNQSEHVLKIASFGIQQLQELQTELSEELCSEAQPVVVGFRQRSLEVIESAGGVRVCVNITQPADGHIDREFLLVANTQPGTTGINDYDTFNQTLEPFSESLAQQCFNITILDDTIPEETETFTVHLHSPLNETLPRVEINSDVVTISIRDDDYVVGFQQESYTVYENDSALEVCVVLKSGTPLSPMHTTLSTENGRATVPEDYVSRTAEFELDMHHRQFCVLLSIINDTVPEIHEEFTVTLSSDDRSVAFELQSANVTIIDDDTAAEPEEGCSVELFVLAATQEQERREVIQNVQNVLPSIFPVPETPTEHDSEEPLRMVYSAIAEEIGVVESDTGYTQFVEAVTEITEAHREACSGGTDTRPSLADVPRLARQFGSLPGNARNAPELRNIFGKLLCIEDQVERAPSTRKKRQDEDPCEDVPRVCPSGGYGDVECPQQFFECLDEEVESRLGTRVGAVFGFIPDNLPCLGFVVDTTGSMGDEIEAVQNLIRTFISGEEDEPACYALTQFNDWGISDPRNYGPAMVYDTYYAADLIRLRNDVNSLRANGGGDCPEYGMNGMRETLQSQHPMDATEVFIADSGSQLIVLTDASALDDSLANEVITDAMDREVCIHFFLSGSGCGSTPGPSGFGSYERVASQTGGIAVRSTTNFQETLIEFGRFVNSYDDSPCFRFYEGGSRRKRDLGFGDEQRCHTFRVSTFTTVLKFLVRTDQPRFTVRDPSGGTTVKEDRTEFVTYEQPNPQTGQWSVCVETGTLSISFNNRVVLDMVVAYVKEDDSAPNRVVATSEIPPACSTGRVVVFTSQLSDISDTAPIHLNLLENGAVRQSATLVKCGGALIGNVTFPLGSVTYQLEGEDQEGNPFLYNSRKRVELQPRNSFTFTAITGSQEVSFQAATVLNFTLQNRNSYGTIIFTISVGRVASFTTRLLQTHISLDAGTSTMISLRVTAAGSTIVSGSTYRFTVTAADGCISRSASQTVRVREFMPATEAPDACGCQNGGTCTHVRRRGRVFLRCRCPPGYGGGQCQTEYS